MAVTRVATPNRYVGLSTDAKPTTDVPAGSRFTERDTGLTYVWDLTAWGVTSISARQNTWTALQTYSANGIGTTPTDRIVLTNTTAAAAGAQQISPAMHFHGSGWKTDAAAAAQDVDARVYLVPVQGAANPTSYLTWEFAVNGGAYGEQLRLSSDGTLTVQGFRAPDGVLVTLGTDGDQVELNHAAGLAADTALTNVLLLTTAGSRQAFAANSRIVSNVTLNGDYGVYVNVAGVSKEAVLVDASTRTITLGWGGFGTTVYANNGGTPEEVLRLTAIASPLSGAPATLFAATQFVSNSVVAGFVMSRLVNSLNNSLLLLGSQTVTSNATGAQYQSTISGRDITDTSGADNGTFFFNIARNHITASDQVTKTSVFMGNTEFDEITYHQASDLAVTFNMHKTVLIRMAGASTGVTLADQHLLDFTLSPIISTGAFTMVKAINIPTASGLSATWYGIFYDNAPNGGSIATASGVSLVLNPGGVVNITPYTLTPTAFTFTGANSTSNSTFTVGNSSNAAASHSIIEVKVGGVTSTGDPQVRWTIPSGTSWYAGPDNNVGDAFILGIGAVVGTTPVLTVWPTGNANGTSHIYTSQGPSMADGAASVTVLHMFTAVTQNEAGVTTRTGLHTSLSQDLLTLAGDTATLIINKAAGISAAGVAQGANISLVHGSGFRALTGGAAVNVSGMYFEAQTAGTTGNYQALFAVSTGAAPALTDHVGVNAQDFAADDTRLYIQSQAGSAIIIGNNAVRTGLAGTATGSFVMSGSTSGVVTLTVAAAAGTYTLTAPALGSNATIAVLETAQTFTALQTYSANGIGTTPTDRIALTNTTAAAAGAQQVSPAMHWTGQGWKTDATAASQALDAREYLVPVQGAANPSSYLTWEFAVNGGAYAEKLRLSSVGILTVQGSTASTSAATGSLVVKGGMGVGNGTAPGTTAALYVGHDDATNAASHARVDISVQHTSADPLLTLQTAATQWYMGVDNSDNDRVLLGFGVVVGTTPVLSFDPRRTTAGILPVLFNGDTFTIASGASSVILPWATGNYITSYTGNTQVTSLQRFHAFSIPTVQADGVGGALTVDKATTVQLSAVTQGANTVLTHSSALRILTSGSGATVSAIYIEDQTGGTADYGLTIEGADTACIWVSSAVDTTDAANGIAFGLSRDTNLYRSAANTLRTNDQFQADLPITVGTAGGTTGAVKFTGTTSGLVTLTVAAAAGTWTMTLPAAVGGAGQQLADLAGNGITGWTDAASRREYKQEITGFVDYQGALQKMLQSPLYTFRYRPGTGHGTGDYDTRYLGVMAGESDWAMHFDGSIVNPVNTIGYMVAGFRAINEVQESQETKIIRLEARVAELEARLAA